MQIGIDRRIVVLLLIPLVAIVAGCASAKYIPTGKTYPAKRADCELEVFSSKAPDRPYEEIGIIEGEGSLGMDSLEEVLPKMIEEACLAGGDALILTSSQKAVTFSGDDEELHAVATVIVWTDGD
jgi:hypothetical protein